MIRYYNERFIHPSSILSHRTPTWHRLQIQLLNNYEDSVDNWVHWLDVGKLGWWDALGHNWGEYLGNTWRTVSNTLLNPTFSGPFGGANGECCHKIGFRLLDGLPLPLKGISTNLLDIKSSAGATSSVSHMFMISVLGLYRRKVWNWPENTKLPHFHVQWMDPSILLPMVGKSQKTTLEWQCIGGSRDAESAHICIFPHLQEKLPSIILSN